MSNANASAVAPREIEMAERKAPKLVKWDAEGERVRGIVIRLGNHEMEGKKIPKVRLLDDEDGSLYEFLCPYDLAQKITFADLGHLIEVRYEGTDPNVVKNGNAMKVFRVAVSRERVLAAPAAKNALEITDDDIPF